MMKIRLYSTSYLFNCVYRLKCKICNVSYIGQTSSPYNLKFHNQKSDIKKLKSAKEEQQIEIVHFKKGGIENTEISIL